MILLDDILDFLFIKNFLLHTKPKIEFSPKIPYNLVAERSEATPKRLQNSYWCG